MPNNIEQFCNPTQMERQNYQTQNNQRAKRGRQARQPKNCYDRVCLHQNSLKDKVWIEAYKTAIEHHQHHIIGKTILDVGCGTGILSILCAQAGASRVYAVDASEIAVQAKLVVKANNLSDIITVIHGRVEDIQIDEKVDVIISEWMGYMLLHESMLGSVIIARDRWLKPGGLILPSSATLYLAPLSPTSNYRATIDFWKNVEGIDMSAIIPLAKTQAFEAPYVERIESSDVLAVPHVVKYINIYSVTVPELALIETEFQFNVVEDAPLCGFAFWFDVEFTGDILSPFPIRCRYPFSNVDGVPAFGNLNGQQITNLNEALVMSTGPEDPQTHWMQTVLYCGDIIEMKDKVIRGTLRLTKSYGNPQATIIDITYKYYLLSFDKRVVME